MSPSRLIKNVIPFSAEKRHIAKQRTLNKFPKIHICRTQNNQKRNTPRNSSTKNTEINSVKITYFVRKLL